MASTTDARGRVKAGQYSECLGVEGHKHFCYRQNSELQPGQLFLSQLELKVDNTDKNFFSSRFDLSLGITEEISLDVVHSFCLSLSRCVCVSSRMCVYFVVVFMHRFLGENKS